MSQVIIRLTLSSNAVGPFDIHTGSTATTPIKTGVTRDQIIAGVVLNLPGSVAGIQYTIFVVNKQPGCNDEAVAKKIIVYEDDVTPTPHQLIRRLILLLTHLRQLILLRIHLHQQILQPILQHQPTPLRIL